MRHPRLLALGFGVVVALLGGCLALSSNYPVALDAGKRIAVFPAFVGVNEDAKEQVEAVVCDILREAPAGVVAAGEVLSAVEADKGLKAIYDRYTSLLRVLSFSDGKLSDRLGEDLGCGYFLLTFVDGWGYERGDKKDYVVVQLRLMLVEAKSGKVLWREKVAAKKRWFFMRPELKAVSREAIRDSFFNPQARVVVN